MAVLGAVGGACGLAFACQGSDEPPSAGERQARSQLVRDLIASRERMPDSDGLQAQRRDLQAELNPDEGPGQGGSGREQPAASTLGTVVWVGNDELLVRDTGGVERDVRIEDSTYFRQGDRSVSRRLVEKGAQVRVGYDVAQGEWVAREVELLRGTASIDVEDGASPGSVSQPMPR
jgi:hypothetical protein